LSASVKGRAWVWCRAPGYLLPFLVRLETRDNGKGFACAYTALSPLHSTGETAKQAASRFRHTFFEKYVAEQDAALVAVCGGLTYGALMLAALVLVMIVMC
jgi:hypothetical protein